MVKAPDVVFIDSDGDGVRGGLNTCPGYDYAIDSDGDSIPDGCEEAPVPG